MKKMRKTLSGWFEYEWWKLRRYLHGAICGPAELSDDKGNNGDGAEQLAEEKGVKKTFLFDLARPQVDYCQTKIAKKDGQEKADEEEEYVVEGEVVVKGGCDERAIGEGTVDRVK